ncbi:MAG: hypothetical protein JKY65_06205 [Planctomycetes bacterium]|nr:hypothetical protein [Planctomycetota bacterium]
MIDPTLACMHFNIFPEWLVVLVVGIALWIRCMGPLLLLTPIVLGLSACWSKLAPGTQSAPRPGIPPRTRNSPIVTVRERSRPSTRAWRK